VKYPWIRAIAHQSFSGVPLVKLQNHLEFKVLVGKKTKHFSATIPLRSLSSHAWCSGKHLQLVCMCLVKMKPTQL